MTEVCSAHRYHWPPQPAPDHHHVIPQAWQRFWRPPGETSVLWDDRTTTLCPNCHRGVHERIVAMMRDDAKPGRDRLWPIAREALDRFTAAGGSLAALRAAREWGEQ